MSTDIFGTTGTVVNAGQADRTMPLRSDFVRVKCFERKETHPQMGLASEKDLTI